MKKLTQAEYARLIGVNRSTVNRYVANGRITVDDKGLIDPQAASQQREATQSPMPHHQARKAQFEEILQAQAQEKRAADVAQAATDLQHSLPLDLAMPEGSVSAALKLETYKLQKGKAELVNIEVDKATGALVERAEVDFVLADFGNTLRSMLENLPDRMSGPLAALRGDAAAIHKALEEAVHELLGDFAAHIQQKVKALDP
ncbi:MAG: hypothetical protein K2Q11_00395 [Burkholderiaceae bacterium]|nr:hypothetical protein [Burkholderiaceae bacterium]